MSNILSLFITFFSLIAGFSSALPTASYGGEKLNLSEKLSQRFKRLLHNSRSTEENLFAKLPDEILSLILEKVDLESFVRLAEVDLRFSRITHDRILRNKMIEEHLKSAPEFVQVTNKDIQDLQGLYSYYFSMYPDPLENLRNLVEFDISKTPVNQQLYVTLMGNNPSEKKRRSDCEETYLKVKVRGKKVKLCPDLPVENVSWEEIQIFLERFTSLVSSEKYVYQLSSRLQHNLGILGRIANHLDPEDLKWKPFEDFKNEPQEWVQENEGLMPISLNRNRPIPAYLYSRGLAGLGNIILRSSADALRAAVQPTIKPYFPITFRLVRLSRQEN